MLRTYEQFNKRRPGSLMFRAISVVILTLMGIVCVSATVPIPLGWVLHYSSLPSVTGIYTNYGIRVYKKNNSSNETEYMTIVDMRYAKLRSFTGEVTGANYASKVKRISLGEFWNRAVAQNTTRNKAVAVINGTFFNSTFSGYTDISFGLESDWWVMSYGYGVGPRFDGGAGSEDPGKIRQLLFNSSYGSSSIPSYSKSNFTAGVPNVIGGLDVTSTIKGTGLNKRTFAGVRDDNNDTKSETVMFFTSPSATPSQAASTLGAFGCGSKIMFDGGSSTGFILNGTQMIKHAGVTQSPSVVQAFVIYTGT